MRAGQVALAAPIRRFGRRSGPSPIGCRIPRWRPVCIGVSADKAHWRRVFARLARVHVRVYYTAVRLCGDALPAGAPPPRSVRARPTRLWVVF